MEVPIGLIVEGEGERFCYPSIVKRLVNLDGVQLPINRPQGCGQITKNLEEELRDLVVTFHPRAIIVTVDHDDVVGPSKTCEQLKLSLQERADRWLSDERAHGRLSPLPSEIMVVIQVKKFESWLLADQHGLSKSGICRAFDAITYSDVDSEVKNPTAALKAILLEGKSPKHPADAKKLVSSLDLNKATASSRSLRKFAKEVQRLYEAWQLNS